MIFDYLFEEQSYSKYISLNLADVDKKYIIAMGSVGLRWASDLSNL